MLFYVRCPSCGRPISRDLDKYFHDLDNILNDPKIEKYSNDSDDVADDAGINKQSKNSSSSKMMMGRKDILASKLLDKYGYYHLCCRIRIMGLIPYHKIIVS